MEEAGLVPVTRRRIVNTTDSKHDLAIFPNLLKQNFNASNINRIWVSDFTYIPTDEGWLYLCSVLDICSRRIVGWALSKSIDRHLAIAALKCAVDNRKPKPEFIFHTDRGCQYASSDFRNAVAAAGGIQSMSAKGNPYDNACAESFFKSLKVECISRHHFATRQQAEHAVARYILFYNRKRIHATLGYVSPAHFEMMLSHLPLVS
jgi:putative transposase